MCEEIEFEIQEEDIPLTMNLEDDVYLVEPKTESLEVTPTKETQYFESETGIYYDNVTVNPIPDEYIIPNLGTKTITSNGTYNATDDNLDGYSQVEVTTSGVDINEYFETTYSGTSPSSWVKNNLVKKVPDLIIDDSVTSLENFCSGFSHAPKIICNSNVTNMGYMYSSCSAKTIDLSGLNTSNVNYIAGMFQYASFVESLDVSSFNTSKVKSLINIFYNCNKLTSLDVSNWNVSNVSSTRGTFYNCSSLTSLNLSNWNVSNVNETTEMFKGCRSLTNLDIRNFDFSNVTSYSNMFQNVPANCLIIVKDDTAKTWIISKFTTLTNVKTVAELEAA